MHADLTRVANSHDFFFFIFFFATIMRRKNWPLVRSCWQLSSSASVLAAEGGMAARVGVWRIALDRVQDAPSWGSCCTACICSCCPRSCNLWGKTRSLLHPLAHPLPSLGVKQKRVKQRRMCSRCLVSLHFPVLAQFVCTQIPTGKRWAERG